MQKFNSEDEKAARRQDKDGGVGKPWAHLLLKKQTNKKLHLHINISLLEQPYNYQNSSSTTKEMKNKKKTEMNRRGVKVVQLEPTIPVGDPEEEGDIAILGSSLRSKEFEPHTGYPRPKVWYWEDYHLFWFWKLVGLMTRRARGLWKTDSVLKGHAQTCSLSVPA